jgi:hypothetical protein
MLANPLGCVHDVQARRSCNLASWRRWEGIVGCVGTLFARLRGRRHFMGDAIDETHSAWTLELVGPATSAL